MGPEGALAISLRIIERTTALIERGWCQYCLAIDASGKDGQLSNALRFSLYGAWLRACHEAESNVNDRQMYLGASIVAQDAIDLAVRETDPDKYGHAGMLGIDKYNRLVKWNNAADRSKDEVLSVLHTASRNLVGDLEAVKGDEGALIVQALSRLGAAGTKQEGKLRRSTVVRPSPSKKVVSRVRNIASLILGLFGWYPAGLLVGQSTGNSLLAVGAAVATFAFACVLVVEERYSSETFWQN